MANVIAACLAAFFLASPLALAQSVEVDDQGESVNANQDSVDQQPPAASTPTGKQKANQYFQGRKASRKPSDAAVAPSSSGATPRYLALHVGTFFTDQAYKWGSYDQKNTGQLNAGVTYRLGEWVNSMDFSIRIEYTNYVLSDGSAKKLSFVPMLTFPDSNSRFPLYFGGGVGPGLFIQQVHDRSPVSLDWQVVAGVRVQDVIQHVGFMVESGLKNHILLLSPGQFNGVFINVGAVFAF